MRLLKHWLAGAMMIVFVGMAGGESVTPAERFSTGPAPTWVTPVSWSPLTITSGSATQLGGAVSFRLAESQVARVDGEVHWFRRGVKQILTESGVANDSQLSFDFDPTYQRLALHSVVIHRGTNRIDRLDPTAIKFVQRETDLERNLYNGSAEALLFVPDVRVGDVLEYSYSLIGLNPVYDGWFADSFTTRWGVPVGHNYIRVLWPRDRSMAVKHFLETRPLQIQTNSAAIEYVWDETDVPPLINDSNLPLSLVTHSYLQFSEQKTWADVANWALRLYDQPVVLTPAMQQHLVEWRARWTKPEDQALAALRFVQDDIRYLGIELGMQSHRPTVPQIVAERRFGDCKDKAFLLCTLFRELGIPAYPALVNTWTRETIADRLPSPLLFNHVIVCAELRGRTYWLDPTDDHQGGGFGQSYLPNYGRALVVRPGADRLTVIPPTTVGFPLIDVRETFIVTNYTAPASLHVECRYTGLSADGMRATFAHMNAEELHKNYAEYYAAQYPTARLIGSVRIADDRINNLIVTHEEYSIPELWVPTEESPSIHTCSLAPLTLRDVTHRPATVRRTMPLAMGYPQRLVHTTEIHLPPKWDLGSRTNTVTGPATSFRYVRTCTDRSVRMHYEYATLTNVVAVADLPAHFKALEGMESLLTFHLTKDLSGTADASGLPRRVNWLMVMLGLMYVALLGAGAVWLFLRGRHQPPVLPNPTDAYFSGIRGWLIIPAIGIFVNLALRVKELAALDLIFNADQWEALTVPGRTAYHPFWSPSLLFEFFTGVFTFVLLLLLAVVFFQKRRLTVTLYRVFLFTLPVVLIIDHLLAGQIPAVVQHQANSISPIFRSIMICVIWGSYFTVSRRVKATFVR